MADRFALGFCFCFYDWIFPTATRARWKEKLFLSLHIINIITRVISLIWTIIIIVLSLSRTHAPATIYYFDVWEYHILLYYLCVFLFSDTKIISFTQYYIVLIDCTKMYNLIKILRQKSNNNYGIYSSSCTRDTISI